MSAGLYFEQVTQEPVMVYRWHDNNKSKTEGGEDDPNGPLAWNFHYPWKDNPNITPFACTMPAPRSSWPVRSYDNPHISVCIACGPGHQEFLQDALDSVAGQSFPLIECVVCNDTGKPLDVEAMGHPWVRVVDTKGGVGPAIARNTAIAAAKAPLIAILDADDMFYPDWLMTAYEAYLENSDCLVYADCHTEVKLGQREHYSSGEFTVERIMGTGRNKNHYPQAIYQSAILFPRQWWYAVGGYPVDQPHQMYEDWLFGVKLHLMGIGAAYCKDVHWGVYRKWTAGEAGSKNAIDNVDHGSPAHRAKYDEICDWIDEKERAMACGGCKNKAKGTTVVQGQRIPVATGPDRVVVYEGPRQGSFTVNSVAIHGKKYRIQRGVPFTVPAADGVLLIERMAKQGYREILPEDRVPGTVIPEQPVIPAEVTVPNPQPEPVVAAEVEEKVPERVDDLHRLGLHFLIEDPLRAAGWTSVADIAFDIRAGDGAALKQVHGIAAKRYQKIVEAVEALEAV
jgi:hypothetical protein